MKIVDLQVIPFRVRRRDFRNGELLPEDEVIQTLTKIITDEGAEGYYLGGHGHGDQDGLLADRAGGAGGPHQAAARWARIRSTARSSGTGCGSANSRRT